jgi:DNA sulfur modification protein DndB
MASKTFVPAFEAKVGNWIYYSCLMSYAQVAREINFAYELGGNRDLSSLIQRGVGTRTGEITEYLLKNENRFLGAIVVAAWGGNPNYIPLTMDPDDEGQAVLAGIDRNFGVLTFDGTQQFFALDGQHRLRAIKDAIKTKPELGQDDISVIVVPHFDTDEGKQRTRRLFTNINRNAKVTTPAENIALDEDDSFAILTRRLIDEHDFLKQDKVVTVFSKVGDDGELRLASRPIGATSPAWTNLGTLYDITKELGFDLPCTQTISKQRVEDDVLDESYDKLVERIDEFLDACGDLRRRYESAAQRGLLRDLRAPKGREGEGHPLMRPVVQVRLARVVHAILSEGRISWPELMKRLAELDWKLESPPFSAVWAVATDGAPGKMITGADNSALLQQLLQVHLAPRSKSQTTNAIREYLRLKGTKYPISPDELFARIPTEEALE